MKPNKIEEVIPSNGQFDETGPYVLRNLLTDIPLSVEGAKDEVQINCVELLDHNLYVGTSSSELLHFVQIPCDSDVSVGSPSYILASRLPPEFHDVPNETRPGVQQILLLPSVNKACILCNSTVTFYSLPELSPAFGTTQIRQCSWIGGVDLNLNPKEGSSDGKPPSVTILASLSKKIRVIRISETPRGLRSIDFSGSVISVRRDSYACVADTRSYALIDVDRLLKIPLFPISSPDGSQPEKYSVSQEILEDQKSCVPKTISSEQVEAAESQPTQKHTQNKNLDVTLQKSIGKKSPHNSVEDNYHEDLQNSSCRETILNTPTTSQSKPNLIKSISPSLLPSPLLTLLNQDKPSQASLPSIFLKPHIVSPTPQEFLLVTGTSPSEPGVGMFVNLEGDPTRSTLGFERYPDDIVVDGRGVRVGKTQATASSNDEGFLLASMVRHTDKISRGIEIQRWDIDADEANKDKFWLEVPTTSTNNYSLGLRLVVDSEVLHFSDVVEKLRLHRFRPNGHKPRMGISNSYLNTSDLQTGDTSKNVSMKTPIIEECDTVLEEWELKRIEEEGQLAKRLAGSRSQIVVWSGDNIWWAVRNPLVLRLDARLPEITSIASLNKQANPSINRSLLIDIIMSLRGREAKTEADYVSLGYIRQKAGLLLFLNSAFALENPTKAEYQIAAEALLQGGLDPRVLLATIPYLRDEIIETKSGIWICNGIKNIVEIFIADFGSINADEIRFGSISNEKEVFSTVDACLLVVLLKLDVLTSPETHEENSVQEDLYRLVDHGVDCFERAVELLESCNRLYALSRLYQSRNMNEKVLGTWQRIIDGELVEGGQFTDSVEKFQAYLIKSQDKSLILRYGGWLASHSPKLGVQVFDEDKSYVKFENDQVIQILRDTAPDAVKEYLELLVFQRHLTKYIDELISQYLKTILQKLNNSNDISLKLEQSYQNYRALRPPKPSYRQFIVENFIEEDWWACRVKLLQLLSGTQGLPSTYDTHEIFVQVAPFAEQLVPEIIILNGRRSNHEEAIRLLSHSLGDYDTAISYCLSEGSSVYYPNAGATTNNDIPSQEKQARLFRILLLEFLKIEDLSDRVEQTSNLLERFGSWLDVEHVLQLIPDTWSISIISGFLKIALKRVVSERNESMIVKALSAAENLKIDAEISEKLKIKKSLN
ncbi:TGF beta receptor associated protein 1 [Blumeria hordei DH14]|uniref:TGF beta receptor associated protein 1 n=1 Tax=Blumeria graminis f. sp. hordei (strain DH14) TaxID=546991 RepID=N1JKK6_BLUG1|nr:TGF beta receptor associated protein 1 [Blumeria hordei DH14]